MCSKIAFSILSLVALILGPASKAQMIPDPGTPDTVALSDVITSVGSGQAVVPVSFYNDEELGGLEVTLTWDSPNVHIDSFSFVGGRVAALSTIGWSATSSTVSIYAVAWTDLIPVGSGLLGNLYVGWPTSIDSEIVTFDTTTIIQDQIEHRTTFSTGAAEMFIPQFLPATLELESSGCCIGDRGNINGSADDNIDVTDLVALVDYMFLGGAEPPCPEEANVNGEGGIDVSDMIALVAYMFQGGDPPAPCY